jgi:chromosome segregation ATPase
MRLEELIEALRTHRSSALECARCLVAMDGVTEVEAARGFRTAMAVAALDPAFGHRLGEALEKLASTGDTAGRDRPELRVLEEQVSELERRQEGIRSEAMEARRLREQVERYTRELGELSPQLTQVTAEVEELRGRIAAKRSLLEELEHGNRQPSAS